MCQHVCVCVCVSLCVSAHILQVNTISGVCVCVWAWAFVVMLRRWEVWLKLANSMSASFRLAFISSYEAGDTGSFHLHCIRAWVLVHFVGDIESVLSLASGMKVCMGSMWLGFFLVP